MRLTQESVFALNVLTLACKHVLTDAASVDDLAWVSQTDDAEKILQTEVKLKSRIACPTNMSQVQKHFSVVVFHLKAYLLHTYKTIPAADVLTHQNTS